VNFVVSVNLHRRHVNASQRAVVALRILEYEEEEARKRQATSTGGADPQLTEKFPEAEKGEARQKAAKLAGVNPQYISDAKKLQAEAPELVEAIRGGEETIQSSKRKIKERKKQALAEKIAAEPEPLPEGPPRKALDATCCEHPPRTPPLGARSLTL